MSQNKKKPEKIINNDEIGFNVWLEIFDSKVKFRILQLLFVYGELSLTELSKYMNKSKPALYHHLKKMMKAGVVKVIREKQVRGSIKAKHYSIDEQTALKIQLISEEELKKIKEPKKRLKALESIIGTYRNSISLVRNKLDILDLYTDFLEEELQSREDSDVFHLDLQSLISDYDIGFHAQYLTEKQYTKLLEYYQDFNLKVIELILNHNSNGDQKSEKTIERPYFITTIIMPLKKLLELELQKMKA